MKIFCCLYIYISISKFIYIHQFIYKNFTKHVTDVKLKTVALIFSKCVLSRINEVIFYEIMWALMALVSQSLYHTSAPTLTEDILVNNQTL